MGITKAEKISIIKMVDKLYGLFTKKFTAKICIKLHPKFKDDPVFNVLFNYIYKLLSTNNNNQSLNKIHRLITLIEQFELSLLEGLKFDIYLEDCNEEDVPLNKRNIDKVINRLTKTETEFLPLDKENEQNFTVQISPSQLEEQNNIYDFNFQLNNVASLLSTVSKEIESIDYYKYDKLYLEAKLESLKKRHDIQILLAGSSYTMCGLFEDQMPLPSRNVAVDAQDLYYTLKTIRTAVDYNKNIKYCIISFAYYFLGYDLSLSTSSYQYRRIAEVNYPVFGDKHNFTGEPDSGLVPNITTASPLEKKLFSIDALKEQYEEKLKLHLKDSRYFSYPRVESAVLTHDVVTNEENARNRASSHNKFFKYSNTVKENLKVFTDFVTEMNSKGIQLVLFVPPVTKYYRKFIEDELVANFYKYMKPLQEKYDFKLIDLFNSNIFEASDFVDYDHLNDFGAKKLGEILIQELAI